MKTIDINEATGPQLVAFAQTVLNIEGVTPNLSKAQMIAKIRATGYDKPTIDVEEAAPAKAATIAPGGASEREMVTVFIPSNDAPGGTEPVFVSVNGSGMLIPRDVNSDIPIEFYVALKNAVRQVYTPMPDGGISEPKNVPAYPFSRVA